MDSVLIALQSSLAAGSRAAFALAAGAGLCTSLSPCCLTSVSVIVALLAGMQEPSMWRSFNLSLLVALGNSITFVGIGLAAAVVGTFISIPAQVLYLVVGAVLVLMALQMWGVVNVLPASTFMERHLFSGYMGALVAGLCSGLFSAPCCTPIIVVMVTIIGASGNIVWGAAVMLAYALAHNAIVIAAGTSFSFAQHLLHSRRFKRASSVLQVLLGLAVLALGLWMLYQGF